VERRWEIGVINDDAPEELSIFGMYEFDVVLGLQRFFMNFMRFAVTSAVVLVVVVPSPLHPALRKSRMIVFLQLVT